MQTISLGGMVQGRYRVQHLLGQGGMGAVYQVLDTRLGGKLLAMKEMSDAALTDPAEKAAAIAAFRQEAELLAKLDHRQRPQGLGLLHRGRQALHHHGVRAGRDAGGQAGAARDAVQRAGGARCGPRQLC